MRHNVYTPYVLRKVGTLSPQPEQAGLDEFAIQPAQIEFHIAEDQSYNGGMEVFARQADTQDVFSFRSQ